MKYTTEQLKEILVKHHKWVSNETGGERADLSNANLRYADLDYSAFPLWCGGSNFKCDIKLIYQLLAHIATLKCEDEDYKKIRKVILPYALKSHRAADLNLE